jgi:hypothetical protein
MKFHYHFIIDIYFRPYSSAEEMAIVHFVVTNDANDSVNGNILWMTMEEQKVRQSKVKCSHSGHLTPECHAHHQVVGSCLGSRAVQ